MFRKAFTKLVYGLKTRLYEGGKRQEILAVDRRIDALRGGKGPTVVYLNSVLAEARWLPFHQRLAQKFEVIAPIDPVLGAERFLTDPDAIDEAVFAFLDLVDGLGLRRTHLVGVSTGGWVAAEIAVRHPERIDRLVLADAFGLVPDESAASARLLEDTDTEALRRILFADPAGPMAEVAIPRAETRDNGNVHVKRLTGAAEPEAEARVLGNPKLEKRLRRITCPTLVLWGERDAVLPARIAEAWRDRIAGAEMQVLEGSGHLPQFEREELFVDAVSKFLSTKIRKTAGERRAPTPGSSA